MSAWAASLTDSQDESTRKTRAIGTFSRILYRSFPPSHFEILNSESNVCDQKMLFGVFRQALDVEIGSPPGVAAIRFTLRNSELRTEH